MRLQTGHFYFEQQNIPPDPQAKSVNYAMLEAIRLIDERQNQDVFVPNFDQALEPSGETDTEDPDVLAIMDTFRKGATDGHTAWKSSGLARVRAEIALAVLCRDGVLRPKGPLGPATGDSQTVLAVPQEISAESNLDGNGKSSHPCCLMDLDGIKTMFLSLRQSTPGLKEVLLISDDGFPIVTTLEQGDEEGGMTSVGAILSESGHRGIRELRLGDMEAVITIGNQGYCVVSSIGRETLLMTVASPEAQLGLLLFKLKRAVPTILKLMGLEISDGHEVP